MKQFTLRGDFDIGKLIAVFEIPSSRWMELVRALGWSNRPTEFSCFSDGVHPGWSSLGCGRLRPRTEDATKSFYWEQPPYQQFVLARFARPVIGRAFCETFGSQSRQSVYAGSTIASRRPRYRLSPACLARLHRVGALPIRKQHRPDVRRRFRRAEQIALHFRAAEFAQQVALLLGLDAFGRRR